MTHVYSRLGSVFGAIAFLATATPAFSQSPHTPVSDDGSVVAPTEASPGTGSAATSSAPSAGLSRVTEQALIAEGVYFDAESRAEFQRLAALPDGGEYGVRTRGSAARASRAVETRRASARHAGQAASTGTRIEPSTRKRTRSGPTAGVARPAAPPAHLRSAPE